MNVQDMVARLHLTVVAGGGMEREITGGYASDLLSCVMGMAQPGNVWITLQAHPNVVAVASMLDLAAVIVTEGIEPTVETVDRAREQGITLLGSAETTFAVVSRLAALGIGAGG
ncbi:MAG: serine kinase [Anaerolineae bacterium]|jgi:serine kinase of HPr protein (carbohydrate metabolism regulator)